MMSANSFPHYSRKAHIQRSYQQQSFSNTSSRVQQPSPLSNTTNSSPILSSSTVSPLSLPRRPSQSSQPRAALFTTPVQPTEPEPLLTTPIYTTYLSPSPFLIYLTPSTGLSLFFSKWWRSKYENSQHPEYSPSSVEKIASQQENQHQPVLTDKISVLSDVRPTTQPIPMARSSSRSSLTTGPVQIPTKSHHKHPHSFEKPVKRQSSTRSTDSHKTRQSRPQDVHSPDAIPESVMSLLAMTDIPKPRRTRNLRKNNLEKEPPLTANCIMDCVTETELRYKLSKSPLDMLLLPPDELDSELDSPISISDSDVGSTLWPRTVSLESMPSFADSFAYDTPSSVDSSWAGYSRPSHLHSRSRKPKLRPTRASLEPVSSPPGQPVAHPLSKTVPIEQLDFRVFNESSDEAGKDASAKSFPSMRSAFKSNLTASIRALRNAAKTISGINFSSIPPGDFLTRSILTIDPRVPFTDERRPPPLAEEPSAALRRYLNPTSSAWIEPSPPTQGTIRTFTASIQMQTYKVSKSRLGAKPAALSSVQQQSASPSPTPFHQPAPQSPNQTAFSYPPGMRQREMRENPDFIRIAVLEMAMRRNGKLDANVPGRARWALPPRKPTRICEVSIDGVPERWALTIVA